jgi:bis(5'-nucleosyl)-tetraphosphatase (symmetrical)
VLGAPDAKSLIDWLRRRPLMHVEGGWAMVHAGLLPQWSIDFAAALAKEVAAALAAPGYRDFLANMYGSKPDAWNDALSGWDRLRVIVNAMTRMRFCDRKGRMDLKNGGAVPSTGYLRWFEARRREPGTMLLFGHWSQLGLVFAPGVAGLDSGCVWGGRLSALRLDDRMLFQVASPGYQEPGEKG